MKTCPPFVTIALSAKLSAWLVFPLLLSPGPIASAAELAKWSFTGQPGNQTSTPITAIGTSVQSASGITRGPGVSPVANTNFMSSDGWTTSTAIDTNDYYQFSITPDTGSGLDLDSIFLAERRSGTGIRKFELRSSLDGYASTIGSVISVPDDTNTRQQQIALGSAFDNVTGIVTFRLYGYEAEAAGGTWRLENHTTAGGLVIDGTVVATLGTLSVSVSPAEFSESATNPAAVGTVTRTGDTTAALTVTLASSDETETTVPGTVEIAAGQPSANFDLNAVNDLLPDGNITVNITASAAGYAPGVFQVTVQDDGDISPVLISQYYEGASSDKWIELHNPTASPFTLTGYRLTNWANTNAEAWKTGGAPSFNLGLDSVTIPAGGYHLIRLAGAAAPLNANADQTDTGSTLGFNGNDSIVLYSSATYVPANIVDAVSLTNTGNQGEDKSFYRLTNSLGYGLATGSNITDFPAVWGVKTLSEVASAQSSDPWLLRGATLPAVMTLTVAPSTFSESAGAGAATGTVAIPSALGSNLVVSLSSSDTTEATVPTTVTVIAGQTSANFSVTAVDDPNLDGSQNVTITANASGYFQSLASITVTDQGDEVPAPTLSPGGIAIVGFNADGNDDLAFVALAPITENTTILFNDNEWNGLPVGSGGAFNTGEGILLWTAPEGGVAVGSVVVLNGVSLTTPSASLGTVSRSGTFNLNADNETLYAYQGNLVAASGFIAAIATHAADSVAGTNLLPSHVVYLPEDVDVAVYTGSRSSQTSFAGYLSLIGDTVTNWITQDGSGDQSADSIAPDLPFSTTAFTISGGGGYTDWADDNAGGQTAELDFDNDGVPNGVEFFMNAAAGFTANPGLVSDTVTWPNGGNLVPGDYGTKFKVQISTTLSGWSDIDANDLNLSNTAGSLSYTPTAPAPIFVRLVVTP